MESQNDTKSGTGYMMHTRGFSPQIKLVAVVLSIFLLVVTIKELRSYKYIGAGVQPTNVISVSGKGEAFAVPDIATFSFTVSNEAKVVKTAQDSVTKTANAILDYLKKAGVEEKDIKTVNYSIYPRYEYYDQMAYPRYPSGRQVLAGYDVSETIEVKVRKIADAGSIITAIGGMGATNLSGLNFTVDDEDSVTAEARTEAIKDAKSKASELAKELGVKLVRIVNYSESGNYPPIYYAKTLGMGAVSADQTEAAQVPAGENKFESNVSITYEIR